MKKTHLVIVLFCTLFVFSSLTKHPVKLTSSELKYDPKAASLQIECKVFIDDFAIAFLSPTIEARMNLSTLTEEDKKLIEDYFGKKFKVFVNGIQLPIKFNTYKSKDNVMTLQFSKIDIALNKGDRILIENELLFDEFEFLQSNWMTLRFPPFISNYNFASKLDKSPYSRTL
ncbi:DUF6702 family protein [Pseudotenacibaculum haliotis]|uniref:DUF6702 family protein n=1 Tax=Pseudotenacibaculum haliotis TaxID=1862138 RepID=A0ABW5LUD9_9FLAO